MKNLKNKQRSKSTAVVLLLTKNNKVLAVTRKGRLDDWGLVGGKVDPNETEEAAIKREVFEESGLTINSPQPIYKADCGKHSVIVFVCKSYSGHLIPEPDTDLGWVEWSDIILGTFGDFNQKLYEYLDNKKVFHLAEAEYQAFSAEVSK